MEFIPDIDLATYSTLRVGGTAKGCYRATNEDEVKRALAEIAKQGATPFVIGAGSNTYFGDGKHDKLILLQVAIMGMNKKKSPIEGEVFTVGAGEDWDAFVAHAASLGLWGVESLAGIPGTVGASPIQNIGAYGTEVADVIEAVEVFDRKQNEVRGIPGRLCGFGYRTSIFNSSEKERYIILRVRFWLHKKHRRAFPKEVVASKDKELTPSAAGEQIRTLRKSKLPDYREYPNCGSFFKNPLVDDEFAQKLLRANPDMSQFPSQGKTKLSAAWLIEHTGLKGKDWGNVSVSSQHALVVTTNGKAKEKELTRAVREIILAVENKFSVVLVPEPNFVQ